MCGIFCGVSCKQCSCPVANQELLKELQPALTRRGPDSSSRLKFDNVSGCANLEFFGSVLWLQGSIPTVQPYQDTDGNVLLWNGDVFSGIQIEDGQSDTTAVGCLLSEATSPQEVLSTFALLHGPWSFVYWQKKSRTLWFGRDALGRHSLLWSQPFMKNGNLCISSIGKREGLYESSTLSDTAPRFQEVPAQGIFSIGLSNNDCCCCASELIFYPWSHQNVKDVTLPECIISNLPFGRPITNTLSMASPSLESLPSGYNTQPDNYFEYFSELYNSEMVFFKECLQRAVRVRLKTKPDMCKDCVNKALLSFEERGILSRSSLSLEDQSFSNIKCFEDCRSQDEITSSCGSSLELSCLHSKVCVLFSGGIDSTVLAVLVDKCVEESEGIDLLNVAFEQNKCDRKEKRNTKKTDGKEISDAYEVPDRITGKKALEELRRISPTRKWNFVEINVTKEQLEEERRKHISELISPQNTVLDDSIACALWFAARGQGTVDGGSYTSPARVVLVGMGADEQLCGYSRHRVEFNRGGWDTLAQEIHKEMSRISSRNLGRDNRIISDLSREPRLPFLDENVISFLNSLPSWKKARLDLPRGVGEKLLLRLVANDLGLISAATFHKRAIQFGSKIAKLQTGKKKGSDVSRELNLLE